MKILKWLLLTNMSLCLFFPVVGAINLHAGEIDQIQAKGEIVVSLNKEYPPFSMGEKGKHTGLDVDLARLLAEYLGVKVRFIQPDTFDQQIPHLLTGKSDIIIAAMTRTVTRGLKVSFTQPYYEISQAALVRRDVAPANADSYFDLLEIKNLKLGVKANTTHEEFARELFDEKALTLYPTASAAADALIKGEVNAMVADSPFVKVWRDTHPEHYLMVEALLEPVTKEYYSLAIRHGDPQFLDWLNLFIDQIKTDGTLDLLNYEYFEQMSWADPQKEKKHKLTRAELLKNEFVARKKAMIEKRRKELSKEVPEYD